MNHDDPRAEIDRLHSKAEDLADLARVLDRMGATVSASGYRREARRLVRQAARLRAQIGED